MKTAGCILLALAALAILIGGAITVISGKSAYEDTVSKPETVQEKPLEVGKEVRIEDVSIQTTENEAKIFLALIELTVTSPESESVTLGDGRTVQRPKFKIPYSLAVYQQDGTVLQEERAEMTASTATFQWIDQAQQADPNTAEKMTISPFLAIVDQSNNQGQNKAISMTVDVVAVIEGDLDGQAKVEDARVAVVKKEIPVMAWAGAMGGFFGAICVGGTLGVIGLILFIIGVSSGKKA